MYVCQQIPNTEYTHTYSLHTSQEESAFDLSQSPTLSLTPEEDSCLKQVNYASVLAITCAFIVVYTHTIWIP